MAFDHFNFIAGIYDRVADYVPGATMLRLAGLPTAGRLLDAGGGTGRVARALQGQAGRVVIADPSPGMLSRARAKGLTTVCAPGEAQPFADGSFARIIMMDTLHHVRDQRQTARELVRLLQPGGRLVIVEPDIRRFAVKLIALFEKLMLMRSHFLSAGQIAAQFTGAEATVSVEYEENTAWVLVQKAVEKYT
jgi:demethylmenaquinone methyltransferase/2-methoxy-6-polyprenyl-1,4-benzoquinol methylase